MVEVGRALNKRIITVVQPPWNEGNFSQGANLPSSEPFRMTSLIFILS